MNREVEKGIETKTRLQRRDFEIFRWLLEMKSSDIEVLHKRFFGGEPKGHLSTARDRILRLGKSGYLTHRYSTNGTNKKFYLATQRAFDAAGRHFNGEVMPRPITILSSATFEHDYRVVLSRMALEGQGRSKNWRSERRLKAEFAARSIKIDREFMPDAVFESRLGKPCAFELEYSPKTATRYLAKINQYVSIMEDPKGLFKNCLFITSSDYSTRVLTELAAPYGTLFRVQSYNHVIGGFLNDKQEK